MLGSLASVIINGLSSPENEMVISSADIALIASVKYLPEQEISNGFPSNETTLISSKEEPLEPLEVTSTVFSLIVSLTIFLPSALMKDDLSMALANFLAFTTNFWVNAGGINLATSGNSSSNNLVWIIELLKINEIFWASMPISTSSTLEIEW